MYRLGMCNTHSYTNPLCSKLENKQSITLWLQKYGMTREFMHISLSSLVQLDELIALLKHNEKSL